MANVIGFPSPQQREDKEAMETLFKLMAAAGYSPQARECGRRAVVRTLGDYKVPQLTFSFEGHIHPETMRSMTAALVAWHNREVVVFAKRAITEIGRLKLELCKLGRSID